MKRTSSAITLMLLAVGLCLQTQTAEAQDNPPAFKAPNGKAFPANWGRPPLRQTRDLRPLPGGYGRGSGTLARWIQENLDKDANKGNPDVKPRPIRPIPKPLPVRPGGVRKAYPKHWGAPPRLQTKDLRPLPGGYGVGSSTLAGWIQKNLDQDAKNGVPAGPAVDPPAPVPVAPRPVEPPLFDPNAKAREQAKLDTAKVQAGIKAWEAAKARCKGNYSYKIGFQSWVGFGHETVIVVTNNKVTERRYKTFNRRRPVPAPRPGGVAPPNPEGESWMEKGKAIGTNKKGAPAKTLDELYVVALETAKKPLKQFERRYIRSDKQGLLVSCFIMDRRIADDAPRNGLVVSSIQLGGGIDDAAAKPATGGGDCALCRTEAHQLHLGKAENGGTITVKKGSILKVKLRGNPTTGFTWNDSTPADVIKLSGKIGHQAGGPALGAPGMSTATYQAMNTGKTQIVLEYKRVFENKPPVNTVKINIVVTEDGRAVVDPAPNNNNLARIAELEKEIARLKDFAKRARFTPEGLKKHNAKLAELENELAQLKGGKAGGDKQAGVPTFEEWVKGGKKIPAGKVFIGGSPWFNESTGKRRPAEEVYKMLFGKKAAGDKGNAKKVFNAPNGQPFPERWGAPPRIQVRDLRVLPNGYGRGSSTLAKWIQQNLDKDKQAGIAPPKPGGPVVVRPPIRPPIVRPGGGRKQYPPHWGDPPRIQTRDLRQLPGGYGMGSGTLAKWIQQNLDKDAAGRKPGGTATTDNGTQIARLEARLKQIKNFMARANLKGTTLDRYNAEVAKLEKRIGELKTNVPKPPQGNNSKGISPAFAAKHPTGSYAPGELLVGVNKGTLRAESEKSLQAAVPGIRIMKTMINDTILHVRLPATTNVEQGINKLKGVPVVRYAELNGIASIQPVPGPGGPGIGIQPVRPGGRVPGIGIGRPRPKIQPRTPPRRSGGPQVQPRR